MIEGIDYDICITQFRIYRYIAQCVYDVKRFSYAFLMIDFCRRVFDKIYSRFKLDDVLESMAFIELEISKDLLKKRYNIVFDEESATWIGVTYRQLYF